MNDGFSEFLLSLEDEDFFAVMRNYLGPLSTPFNKHSLIQRLERFLTREETLRRIKAFLDFRDRELLAAVHYFREPTERDLHFFFGDTHGYLELHNRLLNLQDRLILLTNRATHRFRVNPLLEPYLREAVAATSLVPSRPADADKRREPWFRPSLIPAFMAFLREFPDPLKSSGELKKKSEEALSQRFPLLLSEEEQETGLAPAGERLPPRLSFLLRGLRHLGLLREGAGTLELEEEGIRRLAEFPEEWIELLGICAASGVRGSRELYAGVAGIRELVSRLDPARSYEPTRLGRYLGIILTGQGGATESGEALLESLTDAGFLQAREEGYLQLALSPREENREGEARSVGGSLLSPNFEITLPMEAPMETHLRAAKLARILRYDRFCRYEITRDSFLEGCEGREEGENRIEELRGLTGKLPQNIATTLAAWVSEYGAFRLMEGVVLVAEGRQATLLDHAPAIQPYLRRRLADGVYLLRGPEREWRRALAEIGFEQVPPVERERRESAAGSYPFESPPQERDRLAVSTSEELTRPGTASDGDSREAEQLTERLRRRIGELRTGEEVKQELNRRLDMKLLLYSEQLENEAARRAAAEARGLDYLGKIRIIEAALSASGDLLEVLTRKPGADPERMLLRPRSLEKGSNDVILHGTSLPENRPVKVQVRKIALLRKLTGTLIRTL
ncbi:MAG: hypothetical protein ACLFPP_07745 [Spirochaetaceae bacterium]